MCDHGLGSIFFVMLLMHFIYLDNLLVVKLALEDRFLIELL